ncbi:unnamed protein product [Closterium sp. NIES-65]|nr:unnamed protein product [Closterium sp. NIES-65]
MAEPERVRLPARSTRGKRVSELVGEDLDADEEFWNQKAFQEVSWHADVDLLTQKTAGGGRREGGGGGLKDLDAGEEFLNQKAFQEEAEDVEYATEGEVDEDVFDSDFDDDEPENEEEEPGAEVKERSASPVILSPAASPPSSLFPCSFLSMPLSLSLSAHFPPYHPSPRHQSTKRRLLPPGTKKETKEGVCKEGEEGPPSFPLILSLPAPPAPPAPLTCPACPTCPTFPTHLPHLPHSPAPPAPLTCPTRPTKRRLLPPGTKKLSKKPKKPAKAAKKGVGGRTLVAEKGKASGRVDGEATGDGAEAEKGKSKAGRRSGVGKSRQRRELALLGVGRVKWEGAEGGEGEEREEREEGEEGEEGEELIGDATVDLTDENCGGGGGGREGGREGGRRDGEEEVKEDSGGGEGHGEAGFEGSEGGGTQGEVLNREALGVMLGEGGGGEEEGCGGEGGMHGASSYPDSSHSPSPASLSTSKCMRLATPCMRLATPCIRLASPRMRLASPCMRLASPCQSPRNFPARVHWAVLQGTQLHSVPPFPYSSLPCSVVFPCCCHAIPNARPSLSPFLFLFSSRPPFISLPCSVDPQMAGGASSKEDTSSQEPPAAAAAISNAQNFSIPLFLLSTLPGSVGPQMAGGASRKEEAEESGKGGGEKGGRGRHGREGNIPGGTWADLGGDACSAHTFHVRELPPLATFLCAGSIMMPASFCCQERMDASRTLLAARWQRSLTMRSKVPVGKSSPRPHVQVNNYGRINSPGDDIRVAMAKNASKAASPTAASGASCDGDEANGDDAEEDWPENGHDDSASGDDVGPADIEEDDWWNRPVGSDDEVEEWHVGDSDNDGGKDAHGNNAEAAADAQEATSKSKRARVVLSDDDGPGEERRPILTAAEKGKAKVAEAPAKAPAKAPARRRTSNKKLTSDGDPGSSKGAAKKKAKKAPNPDDIVVNEPLGSDDEYAAAAGPIPTFPEKDNGWMDETAVQTWLSKEVLPHLNPQRGQNARQAMLVLDSYRGHITQTMLQSYRTHSITPAVIPAGCTSQIQPLDVSINRCFKAAVRARYAISEDEEGEPAEASAPRGAAVDRGGLGSSPQADHHRRVPPLWDLEQARRNREPPGDVSPARQEHHRCLRGHVSRGDHRRQHAPARSGSRGGGGGGDAGGGRAGGGVATGLEVLYQETPNYRGAAAKADRMVEPRETARHA